MKTYLINSGTFDSTAATTTSSSSPISSPISSTSPKDISVMTWNVLTEEYFPENVKVDHPLRRNLQMSVIRNVSPDIILLQETDDIFMRDLLLHPVSKEYTIVQTDSINPYGQISMVKKCHPFTWFSHSFSSKKSHKKIVTTKVNGINIVNCHLTAGGGENFNQRKRQLEAVSKLFNGEKCIVAGDTNMWNGETHPENWLDLCPKRWLTVATHSAKNNNLTIGVKDESRFDRFYSNFPISVTDFTVIEKVIGSDHYPCIVTVHFEEKADEKDNNEEEKGVSMTREL